MKLFAPIIMLVIPVLAGAQEQAVQYQTTQLSETVYMLKGRGGNVAISAGEDGVFIIDDQIEPLTDQLVAAIAEVSQEPIRFVINTHYHGDHVGGNETISGAGAVIVAHDNIRQRMSTDQFSHFFGKTTPPFAAAALPVLTFNDQISLHLNGEPATAFHVPRGHTDGDSIIHFPASNVIHMGDIYFEGLYPFIDLDGGGSIQGTIAGVNRALKLANDDTKIIPGHGPLSDLESLRAYRDYLLEACSNVQALIDQDKSLAEIVAAKPTQKWDESLGKTWISPEQFVIFIHNSLQGIEHFTPIERAK